MAIEVINPATRERLRLPEEQPRAAVEDAISALSGYGIKELVNIKTVFAAPPQTTP
jgi:hypothetical protein